MPGMLQVGLTGNIASGKSRAASVFAELGAHVIDADVIAHELMQPGSQTCEKVVAAFGEGILNPDGTINRRSLGTIVFNDTPKRLLLNSLVHPDVRDEVLRRIFQLQEGSPNGIVIVDAALMVESGFYRMHDVLIVVTCDAGLQSARLMNRSDLTLEEARSRMEAQMPVEEKVKLADYVIDTSGTFRETRVQIEEIYKELLRRERESRNPVED